MKEDYSITLRTRKIIRNALLERRQMIVDITHPNQPSKPNKKFKHAPANNTANKPGLSNAELCNKLSELYQVPPKRISVFGFRNSHGGEKSTGFALIYDSHRALKRFEPRYRLLRLEYAVKIERPIRQHRSHFKNWADRFWGKVRSMYRLKAGRGPKKTVPWDRERELED